MSRRPRTRGQLIAVSALEILGAFLAVALVGLIAALPSIL